MQHRNITLIYFSPTENTKKIVEAVGAGAAGTGSGLISKAFDLTLPQDRALTLEFGPEDLVVIGVPVYAGRIPELMAEWMVHLRGNQTPVIMAVVYGNRDYEDALIELKDVLTSRGFLGLAGAAFVGEHSYTTRVASGRPDPQDLEEAMAFGAKSASLIPFLVNNASDHVIVSGKTPYKERSAMPPMAPVTSRACIKCGICAARCPVAAIDPVDFSMIEAEKCIRCCSCVRKCPVDAKYFEHESIRQITKRLVVGDSVNNKCLSPT